MTAAPYLDFLTRKQQLATPAGIAPGVDLNPMLYDFQRDLVEWALGLGRAALFADCGLGKTPMQLEWARQVWKHTGGSVLILAPLAVSAQTRREGAKFGIGVNLLREPREHIGPGIYVTNYERLHHFEGHEWAGVVLDESSILKSFDGARRTAITAFMRAIPYRLLCTATAAPNDYIELGTSSEALGALGYMDMLTRYFVNDQRTAGVGRFHGQAMKWRFKGHAEQAFWRWVCSWARAMRKPSDLGYSDEGFILPPLTEQEHVVEARTLAPGALFSMPARDMREERAERRRTIQERCEKAAELVADTGKPAVVWCHLNDEGNLLAKLIPDSVQVSGATPEEAKEDAYAAFADGRVRVMICKPKIGAWGLNWQHCAHVVTFASHSYEQYYQSVRRCWRYGQTSPVVVDLVVTEGERGIRDNLRRKSRQAEAMFESLVAHMTDALQVDSYVYPDPVEVPSWL